VFGIQQVAKQGHSYLYASLAVFKRQEPKTAEASDNYSCKSYLRQAFVSGKAGMGVLEFPVNIVKVGIVLWAEFTFYVKMRNGRNY